MKADQHQQLGGYVFTPVGLHQEGTELTPDIVQRLTPYIIQSMDMILDEKLGSLNSLIEKVGDITELKAEINQLNDKLSEFICDSEDEPNIIYIEQMSRSDAKSKIISYFDANEDEEVYPSEISENLHIDYDLVWEIVSELKDEGFIETGD